MFILGLKLRQMRNLLFLVICLISDQINSATFSSVATGNWGVSGTWSVVGVDSDGIPDADDDISVNNGHTVTLTALSDCRALLILGGGNLNYNNRQIRIRGNFTRQGSTTGTGTLYFQGVGTIIDITGQYSNPGNWYIQSGITATISASTNISKTNYIYVQNNCTLINNGVISLPGGAVSLSGTGSFIAGANSTLQIGRNLAGTNFNFTASGNTVRYSNALATAITRVTYHNLTLGGSTNTRSWSGGALQVNGNLTIENNNTLNWAGQDINLGGNWVNQSGNCLNMGTLNFIGSGTQTISRTTDNTEFLGSVSLNNSGTVQLNDTISLTGGLTINSGTLDVSASNFAIRTGGNFTDNSNFNARQGTVFLIGTVAQTIGGTANTAFYNITSQNTASVSVSNAKRISNILQVNSGSFGTGAGGTLTLLATGATTHARIGPLGAGASLSGTGWIIQSFVNGPATAFWQYLSTPINGNTIADWDGDSRFYMSGVGGNDGNACCPIFRSVQYYQESNNSYPIVTSTGHSIVRGRGYLIWMAENRTQLLAPIIYDSRGIPNFNGVGIGVTAGGTGGGYNLVGNPYACSVDFASVVASNGGLIGPNFSILLENGSYATNPNSGVIGPNQGFMVFANSSGTLNFAESHKNTTATPALVRSAQGENQIYINVSNEVSGRGEQTVIQFREDATFDRDAELDLPYIQSPYEDASRIFTTDAFGNQYLYNNIHAYDEEVAVPLTVVASAPGVQKISFQNLNRMFAYNCAYLEDTHTGTITWLNDNDVYNFESAVGEERQFVLHFNRKSDCQLPLSHVQSSLDASSQAFMSAEMIKVMFNFEETQEVVVSVYDITGKEIIAPTRHLVSGETLNIGTVNTHGIYLIRIAKGTEVVTKKLYY
jgi:hypothetical protein